MCRAHGVSGAPCVLAPTLALGTNVWGGGRPFGCPSGAGVSTYLEVGSQAGKVQIAAATSIAPYLQVPVVVLDCPCPLLVFGSPPLQPTAQHRR